MTVIPIFIHIREKSEKELQEEMARESRWRKMVEEDERRMRERLAEIERKKQEEKIARKKQIEKEYEEARAKDPWQYTFLPEGWSIFGQTFFGILEDV